MFDSKASTLFVVVVVGAIAGAAFTTGFVGAFEDARLENAWLYASSSLTLMDSF